MHSHHHRHQTPALPGPTGPTASSPTAIAPGAQGHDVRSASADDIRLCAYRKWESAGRPTGDGIQFWLEAEQELGPRK